jgi:hypothetical protein
MATVYVKSVEASSWSRSTWDDTGATNYVVGERVYKAIADGSAYENLAKTYVCIVDNNSTTDPETDTANWARVGFSEEYPFHAPGGSIETTTTAGEVYLDGENQRYKGLGTPERSFYHHAQNFGADSEGTIIFLDGTYTTTSPIPGDKINYVAKNQGKVTFNLNTSSMSGVVFGWNYDYHNRHEGINYQVGGAIGLFQHNAMLSSFKNCVFTDENSIYGNYTSASNSLGYTNFVEFENCVLNLPNSTCHIAGHNLVLGPNGRDALWKNSTFIMQLGNSNEYEPLFFQTNANSPITLEKCVFYITSHVYSGAATDKGSGVGQHNFMDPGVKATDCVAFSANNSLPEIISNNSGLTIRNPLFIDPSNGDFRLRPSSPLIGGGLSSSKFPADAVWMQEGSGTGTGTESDPYYYSDQYSTAVTATAATVSKQLVFKDGTYQFSQAYSAIFLVAGFSDIKLVSENLHGSTITDVGWRIAGSPYSGVTFNIKDFIFDAQDHFIQDGVGLLLVADNCKFLLIKYIRAQSASISNSIIYQLSDQRSFDGQSDNVSDSTFIMSASSTGSGPSGTAALLNNCIFWSPNPMNVAPGGTTTNCASYNFDAQSGCVDSDPLFIDVANEDYRLRPSSPLIGGISTGKYSSDTIWISEGSGTGTGTEEDPFQFEAWVSGASNGFADAVNAAISNGTFKVVFKNGNYRFTVAGEHLTVPNLGLVTLIAENPHEAILSGQREINIGTLTSQGLKLEDFKLTIASAEHFIHTAFISQPFNLSLKGCYVNFATFMSMGSGSSLTAEACIIEKSLGSNTYFYSGTGVTSLLSNCLLIDRNLNGTNMWNHGLSSGLDNIFKGCIFRSENVGNNTAPAFGYSTLINCAAYNYNTSSYSDTEIILNGDPMMVNFDSTSHEASNYQLRPNSPLIGKG